MILLIDTREQHSLPFEPGGPISEIRQQTLEVGDYTAQLEVDGAPILPVRFERKSIPDLYGTMTEGYPRFKKEMAKARDLKLDLILLIEGSLTKVADGSPHSTFSGPSMIQKLFTLQVRHKLPIIFCTTRQEMVCWITEYCLAVGREYVKLEQMQMTLAKRWAKAKAVVEAEEPND